MKYRIFIFMSIDANTFYSALSNDIRLRCLLLMQQQGELCVCELTYVLGLSQPMVSRHLALLREMELVNDRREGQWIYYRIHPALATWAKTVLRTTAKANIDSTPFCDDLAALRDMPNRPGAACCA